MFVTCNTSCVPPVVISGWSISCWLWLRSANSCSNPCRKAAEWPSRPPSQWNMSHHLPRCAWQGNVFVTYWIVECRHMHIIRRKRGCVWMVRWPHTPCHAVIVTTNAHKLPVMTAVWFWTGLCLWACVHWALCVMIIIILLMWYVPCALHAAPLPPILQAMYYSPQVQRTQRDSEYQSSDCVGKRPSSAQDTRDSSASMETRV